MDQHLYDTTDELFNDLRIEIATLKEESAELYDLLDELCNLVEDAIDGSYELDSFTTRPARLYLEYLSK